MNTPLQGTAADLIKIAMLRIDQAMRERKLKSVMTLQVHDELLFDVVPEEAEEMQELVKREMEHRRGMFSVPIVAEVGLGRELAGYQVEFSLECGCCSPCFMRLLASDLRSTCFVRIGATA